MYLSHCFTTYSAEILPFKFDITHSASFLVTTTKHRIQTIIYLLLYYLSVLLC
jgi:hypothetical protein